MPDHANILQKNDVGYSYCNCFFVLFFHVVKNVGSVVTVMFILAGPVGFLMLVGRLGVAGIGNALEVADLSNVDNVFQTSARVTVKASI